jgi:hypothetical protein
VANVKSTGVSFSADNDTRSTLISSTSDHDINTSVHVDEFEHLVVLNVELDSVVDSNQGIRVTKSSSVVGDNVGDTSSTQLNLLDLEELVCGFFSSDAVDNKSACKDKRISISTNLLLRMF